MRSDLHLFFAFLASTLCLSGLLATDTTDMPAENKARLYQCLNTCAMCVEHWESGIYNGPRCAKQCIKHKGHKIVDPDCVKLKMFNYDPEVIKEHRKFLRQQNRDGD